jgi:DNA-3-methyladenine glycosylase II
MSQQVHHALLERSRDRFAKVYALIDENGPLNLTARKTELFEYMARIVAGQQLSGAAARTIWSRVQATVSEGGRPLSEYCCESNSTVLRTCGLSRNKIKALIHLREAFADKLISERQICGAEHAEIVRMVSGIWGFGQWSADMVAIFYCGLPDVWSEGDSSLQKGVKILCDDASANCSEIATEFSPFRSYLALHVWKGIDDGILKEPRKGTDSTKTAKP